jgi:anti-sigma B factor antagonist
MHTSKPSVADDRFFQLTEELLEPSVLVLTVFGELDIATAPELRTRLTTAYEQGVTRLIVDLRSLSFLDSVAVATLLQARSRLGDEGRMGVVVDPDSYIRLILEVAGMPRCLDIVETREQAVTLVSS